MIRTPEAKQLCTKTEFDLFTASLSRSVRRLDEKELRSSVVGARRARDKYRSIAQRQRREARGKQGPRGRRPSTGAQRTVRKVELFTETLARYEKQLTELKKASKTTATRKTTKTKAAKKRAPAKKSTARTSASSSTKKAATKKVVKANRKSRTTAAQLKIEKKKKRVPKTKASIAAAAVRHQQASSGLQRKQKHLSAQAKRTQARRDAKSR